MSAAEFPPAGRRRAFHADAAMAAVILLLGVILAAIGGSNVQRWRSSPGRQLPLGFEDQLGVAANTAGLIVIVWWGMSCVIAVAAALLDRCGNARAASAAGKFTPAFMRRLALAAVGLQLVTAPLAAASPLPAGPGTPGSAPAASAAWTPPAAPATTGTPRPATIAPPGPQPDAPAVAQPQWRPLSPVVEPGPLAGRPLRQQQPGAQSAEVTVRAGDSLWSLSSARLGPFASDVDIALDWPLIYQANRDIIGGNPNLLRPGQVLQLPPGH
ncbi:nucleoid-associated protein YgaU [Pseudarthrobacter oxydans]|uniref:LysM peptidoglycan-binding domain-containing protein n=1 Tax=Pseudarthrobacter oxydans TaxID=1671 RepID=UPI00278A1FB6|nr:LysM domain-containing protein [Pseudarthrobacter oxydans]MDP9981874.1 nucleoid-associated protein YgaU [Pseudarthrobacter oxydans]